MIYLNSKKLKPMTFMEFIEEDNLPEESVATDQDEKVAEDTL